MASPLRLSLLAGLVVTALGGCSSPAVQCRVGADCASGACLASGTCAEPTATDAGGLDGGAGVDGGGDGGQSVSDGGTADGSSGSDGGALTCSPNQDGTLERSEVILKAGLRATFKIASNVTVDTVGAAQPDGSRKWDLSAALSGDHGVLVETLPIKGQWFEASFPTATYAAKLSDSSDLLGVFEATPTALLLRGVVSPADNASKTNLKYDPPATVLAFPIRAGDLWRSSSTVSGTAGGFAVFPYTEVYDSKADARGTMTTPFGSFAVLRVRTDRVVSGTQTTRSFLFVSECFGTVATLVSKQYETAPEFTTAAEVRRLSP